MSVRKYTVVERTLHVADCPTCEFRTEKAENPPRETRCPTCKTWVPFEKVVYESKEYGQ